MWGNGLVCCCAYFCVGVLGRARAWDRQHDEEQGDKGQEETVSRDRERYGLEVSIRQEGHELLAFSRTAARGLADETGRCFHRGGKTGDKQRHGEGWAVALFFEGVSMWVVSIVVASFTSGVV